MRDPRDVDITSLFHSSATNEPLCWGGTIDIGGGGGGERGSIVSIAGCVKIYGLRVIQVFSVLYVYVG